MKPEIIESLRYSANVLAWIMGQNQGKFEGFSPDANSLVSERISSNAVKFTLNGDTAGAYIMFKDIRPNKISSTVYDDPKSSAVRLRMLIALQSLILQTLSH